MLKLFKNKDTKRKLIVLLICLGIFKLGMHIRVPFINGEVLAQFDQGSGILSMLNTFTGGALSSFSIFAVGIMPYITASIIVQLLQMDVLPKFTEWREQGEYGQKRLKQTTYGLTLCFAVIQSIALSVSFNHMYVGIVTKPSVITYFIITSVLTLGTVLLVVMGEIIEHKGIGKGISIIILAGILMTLPKMFIQLFTMEFGATTEGLFISVVKVLLIVLFMYFLLLSIIIVNGGSRKVPIQSSNNGKFGTASKETNFLPVKLNAAGVIPVIFASAMFMLPTTFVSFFGDSNIATYISSLFSYSNVVGIVFYALIIIMFTYFYAFVQINPHRLADDLHMSGSFIPGIRPGANTRAYFIRLIIRLTFVGSIFLALIAILPMLLGQLIALPQQLMMFGTSLIIVVSVIVEMQTQLNVEMTKSQYTSFKKSKNGILWAK